MHVIKTGLVMVALGLAFSTLTLPCRSQVPAATQGSDAASVTAQLTALDPAVRNAACNGMMDTLMVGADKPWVTGEVLVKWILAMENCPPADLHRNQNNYWSAFIAARRTAFVPDAINQLVTLGNAKDPATRRAAVIVLGGLRSQDRPTLGIFAQTIKDPESSVRQATIYAVAESIENSLNNPVPAELRTIVPLAFDDADPAVRERAVLALFMTHSRSDLLKLEQGAKTPDTALIALLTYQLEMAKWNQLAMQRPGAGTQPDAATSTAAASLLEKRRALIPALRHPWFWVRAFAINGLSVTDLGVRALKPKVELLAAIADANPDVARDAALRLGGQLAMGLPNMGWPWTRMNLLDPQFPEPRIAPASLAADLELCRNPQPAQRLEGIAHLQVRGPAAIGAIPALSKLFADPDKSVCEAARRAAQAILKDTIRESAPAWPTTVQPATAPLGTRPSFNPTPIHTRPN